MLEKVLKTIDSNNLIEHGDKIVVAVSGGPDSVCLLHTLYSLKEKLSIQLFAVHINHMLRGSESDADEAYTIELCTKMGIQLHNISYDIKQISKTTGESLEEAGREIRYREFYKYADEVGANKIAVAHNKNDQVETILMHIIRGSGLQGLVGMEYKRDSIIRPLLNIRRIEIEKYCNENSLNPRIDSTNLKSDFTRNRIRLELIPYIDNNFGSDITESICRMSSIVSSDNDYIEGSSIEAFNNCVVESGCNYVHLKLNELKKLHPSLCSRVLRHSLQNVKGSLKGIERVHIDESINFINKGRTGSTIQLPGGIKVGISYELLKVFINIEKKEKINYCKPVIIPGTTTIDELFYKVEASLPFKIDKYGNISYNSLVQFFDYDKLKKGINIRNRCNGDVFKPLSSNGTKKLKEYFIDKKIPREKRDQIPLIAYENEIVWVIGDKISDKFKVTENTKNIIKLEFKGI